MNARIAAQLDRPLVKYVRAYGFVLAVVFVLGAQLVLTAPTFGNVYLALLALAVVLIWTGLARWDVKDAHDRAVTETYAKVMADLNRLGQDVAPDGRVVDVELPHTILVAHGDIDPAGKVLVETRTDDEIMTSIEEKVDHALDIVTGAKR